MSGQCNAKALRRATGWYRWFAACPCGWRTEAAGREDAAALAKRHNTEKATTCEHGSTMPHEDRSFLSDDVTVCPGPSA